MEATQHGFDRIGVVGAGIMGSGIAEVCARAGSDVVICDVATGPLEASRTRIERSLDRAVRAGKLDEADRGAVLERIAFTTELGDLRETDLAVEAASERKPVKLELFERLGAIAGPGTVLATNTSSIPIVDLAVAAGDARTRVLGMHFFNPVPVMPLVEIIPCLLTDDDATARCEAFARDALGKDVIRAPDRAGFTVNALLIPYLLAAIRMVEQGLATPEDIDTGMKRGCGHPMGPLELSDLIGLDTVLGVSESLYLEHRETHLAPPPLLQRLVAAGLLGRKTGRGLLAYDK
jgi:3-hydroxybutyryl-CoA dehydrogenase